MSSLCSYRIGNKISKVAVCVAEALEAALTEGTTRGTRSLSCSLEAQLGQAGPGLSHSHWVVKIHSQLNMMFMAILAYFIHWC